MGFIGNILSGILGMGAQGQANKAANQASDAQNQIIQHGLLPIYQTEQNDFAQNYQPLQDSLAGQQNALAGTNQTGIDAGLLQALLTPQGTTDATGVNQGANVSQALQLLMNPGGNLAGAGGVGGTALNYQLMEALRGIDPAVLTQALSAQDAGSQREINSLAGRFGESTPNIAGSVADLGNSAIMGDAAVNASYLGQNQAYKDQGMANALSTAGGIDTTALNQILQGLNVGGTYQTNVLGNLGAAHNLASGNLTQASNFLTGGDNLLTNSASGLSGIGNAYGSAAGDAAKRAQQYGTNAANQFGQAANSIASMIAGVPGGLPSPNPGSYNLDGPM